MTMMILIIRYRLIIRRRVVRECSLDPFYLFVALVPHLMPVGRAGRRQEAG